LSTILFGQKKDPTKADVISVDDLDRKPTLSELSRFRQEVLPLPAPSGGRTLVPGSWGRYPSHMTDAEWALIAPLLPQPTALQRV